MTLTAAIEAGVTMGVILLLAWVGGKSHHNDTYAHPDRDRKYTHL